MSSNPNQQIVTHPEKPVSFPSNGEWQQIIDIASRAFKSGLLPVGIKSPEAASIIALKAWELGLPPMMAFSHIHIINGKPTLSAELMQSLARKNLPGLQISILETTDLKASVRLCRPEKNSQPVTFSFNIEDAKKAGLLTKDVWKNYPKAMLFSRCISAALRMVCPDALMGVSYTPEELGSEVNEGGNVIETTHRPVDTVPAEPPKEGPPEWLLACMNDLRITREKFNLTVEEVSQICSEQFKKASPKFLTQHEFSALQVYMSDLFEEKPKEHPDLPKVAPLPEAQPSWLDDPRNVK
jgi:hypothetical protein